MSHGFFGGFGGPGFGGPGFGGPGFGGPGFGGPGFGGPGFGGPGFGGPGAGGPGLAPFGKKGRHGLRRAAFVTAALLLDGPADAAQVVQRVSDATGGAFTLRRTWPSSRSAFSRAAAWSPSTAAWRR